MNLPTELWTEIGKDFELSDISELHKINRAASRSGFNLDECCLDPTNLEVATWIINQSQLLSHENTYKYSIFKPRVSEEKTNIYFDLGDIRVTFVTLDKNHKHIYLHRNTGQIIHPDMKGNYYLLETIDDILHVIGDNSKVDITFPYSLTNLNVIRDILSLRASCILGRFSSDMCYIKLLSKHLWIADPFDILNIAWSFTDSTRVKLETYLRNKYKFDSRIPLDDKREFKRFYNEHRELWDFTSNDTDVLTQWLKEWILTLTPQDLPRSPDINYENVLYT